MSKTRWIWPALVLLAAAGGFLVGRHGHSGILEDPRVAQLSARVQELEAQTRATQSNPRPQEGAPLRSSAPSHQAANCPPAAAEAQADSELQQLRAQLASSRESANQVQSRVSALEEQLQQASLEQKRLTASDADLKAALASAQDAANDLQAELQNRNQRALELEKSLQKLREQGEQDSRKLQQISKASADLQDLSRRREVALAAVLRRYKDIAEQYRTLSGSLESRRGPDAAAAATSPDPSRIQNAIALADEDLRHLNTLTAQLLTVQRRMLQ